MAMLIDGTWTQEDNLVDAEGRLQRPVTGFRNWITADGAPGSTGSGGFKAGFARSQAAYDEEVARVLTSSFLTGPVDNRSGQQHNLAADMSLPE